jgi:hypothetical protein
LLLLRPPADVLVVVHPHLEHLAPHGGLRAELLHQRVVLLLHPPPEPLRERQHLLLLLRRELGPEPLPARRLLPLRCGGRRPPLLAGGLGGGAGAAAGRAAVRERVVGVGRRHEQRGRRRRGEQQLPAVVLAVEAAVAAAGGALERVVVPGHELPAPVHDVAAQRRGVVVQALVVPDLGERRRGADARVMVEGLLPLPPRKFHQRMPGCRRP